MDKIEFILLFTQGRQGFFKRVLLSTTMSANQLIAELEDNISPEVELIDKDIQ